MKITAVRVKKPAAVNFILCQSHFIKTVEDVYETLVEAMPGIKFGLAFSEASGLKKIRFAGTDKRMIKLALVNARAVACGHSLFIFLKNAFPVNILGRIKAVSEIATVFCATANQTEVVVSETKQGRGILGIIDGGSPTGTETAKEGEDRKKLLRTIGYKL